MKHRLSLAVACALHARHCLPLAAAAATLAASLPLQAQQATQPDPQAKELDAVKVTAPNLSSQAESIAIQREAVNVVTAISADAVGDFPDQTAAAALSRTPGVAVQRDQGQERYIQLRGAPEYWTAAAFDGINVLGLDLESNSRAFRFDAVPANVIDVVTINKTLTPAMPSEALAGRVNIETVSPMAQRGFHGQAGYGFGTMRLGGGNQHQGDVRLSWSNDRFGVLLGTSAYQRDQTTDNREASYSGDMPTKFDMRSYLLTRETNSHIGKLEFRPADGHRLTLTSLYTEFKDHERRNQYVFNIADAAGVTATPSSGSLTGVPVQGMLEDGRYATKNWINTLSGSHALDTWQLDWSAHHSKTKATAYLPIVMQYLPSVDLDYDRSNPDFPIVTLRNSDGTALSALDQADSSLDLLYPYDGLNEARQTTFKFDARRPLALADEASLSLGLQLDRRSVDGYNMGTSGAYLVSVMAAMNGLDWDLSPYVTDKPWDSSFSRGFDVNYIDNAGVRRKLEETLAALGYSASMPADSLFDIDEDVQAAYGQLELRQGAHQLLGGVRVERTKVDSRGYGVADDGSQQPVEVRRSETRVYPSLHWNWDLSETLKLRNALVTGSARPGFGKLRAGASIDDVDKVISGGNPALKPERAWGYDGSLEWYFAEASMASVGVFYRDVSDVLYTGRTRVTDGRYDSNGVSRQGYELVSEFNGDSGRFTGLELNWLQGYGHGFGSQINLSLIDSKLKTLDGRSTPFSGTSKQVLNTSVFWENFGWSVRLAYQWRKAWLSAVGSGSGVGDEYRDDVGQLDLSVRYALNPHVSFFFDGNNLTNETFVAYEGQRSNPTEVESIGRRFMAGVRVKF